MEKIEPLDQEQMNIVIVWHVDHGKSTLIGRLLADTHSLPEGKLEDVKQQCQKNSQVFEYAFLVDALKDERSRGITIDTSRCFFKTKKRHYTIIDAPGHIGFLKNMISWAARAEAAILVIDAHEGIQENSRRHAYMLSMLGIKQIAIVVNKMDLHDYDEKVFKNIKNEYTKFLKELYISPQAFIPISARIGENITKKSENMTWYKENDVLTTIDNFKKEASDTQKPFRLPVQDIYKFTQGWDDRRIIAGRVESGNIQVGNEVVFYPSWESSKIKSIEEFNAPTRSEASYGESIGVTLEKEIYIKAGEIMTVKGQKAPMCSITFHANIFWMWKEPMVYDKEYKLKLWIQQVPVTIKSIVHVLNASDLTYHKNSYVSQHEVAECILQTNESIAFDYSNEIANTGRFVIVDNYDIAGWGIILSPADIVDDKENYDNIKNLSECIHESMEARIRDNTGNIKKCIEYNDKQQALIEDLQKLINTAKKNIDDNDMLILDYKKKNKKIEEKIENMIRDYEEKNI